MALISFVGYLGGDPEVVNSASGVSVTKFRVAEKIRGGKDAPSQWFRCVAFGDFGVKVINEYARTGTHAYITGDLQERTWKDKDNRTQRNFEVIVNTFQILSSAPAREDSGETEEEDLNPPA